MSKSSDFNPSSWFNNIFFRRIGGNNVYTLTNPDLGSMLSVFTGGYSESNMMLLVQTIPELMFVVNAVASRVKNGVFKLVDKNGEEVTDNALWNKVKERPNWQYSFQDFVWHAVVDRLVTGNRYGYSHIPSTMTVKHKNIVSLWLLPPHYVFMVMKTPRPSYLTTEKASDYIDHYHYNGGDTMSDITPEYVVHDIYMKLGDATDIITGKGISPFKAGEKPLSNLTAVYCARNVIYVRRGASGMVVSAAKDASGTVALTPDEKKEVQDDIQERFGLGGGQSPWGVTNQPVAWVKMGSEIRDLEPFRETEASCAALCGIIGVPTSLMPKGTDAKFANLDIAERNIYENVIFAEADDICRFLTELGRFNELGYKVTVSFDHVTALQDDAYKSAQAVLATAQAAIELEAAGMITTNEGREMLDREAVEGGDEFAEDEGDVDVNTPPVDPSTLPAPEATETVPGEKPVKRKKTGLILFGKKLKLKKKGRFLNDVGN